MRIQKIELHGFRGFRDFASIDVPDGYLVIQGANGAGKSTLFDAVEFCLTGTISKYPVEKAAKESVADYIWWRGDGPASDRFVRVHFSGDDHAPFVVTRTPEGCDKGDAEIIARLCKNDCPDNALQILTDTTLIRDESISSLSLDISETERYQRVQRALGAVLTRNLVERADKVARKADEISRTAAASEDAVRRELNNSLSRLSEARAALVEDKELKEAEEDLRKLVPNAPVSVSELIVAVRRWQAEAQAALHQRLELLSQLNALRTELSQIRTPEFLAQLQQAEALVRDLSEVERTRRAEEVAAQKVLFAEREADALASSLAALLQHGDDLGLNEGHCPLCDSVLSEVSFRQAIERGRARLARRGSSAETSERALADATTRHSQAVVQLETAQLAMSGLQTRKDSAALLQTQVEALVATTGVTADDLNNPQLFSQVADAGREQGLRVEQRLRILEGSRALAQVRELEEKIRSLRVEVDKLTGTVGRAQRATASAKLIQHSITRTAGEMLDERLAMISPLLSELFLRLKPHGDWRSIEYKIRGDVRRFLSLAVGSDLNPQFVFSSGQRRITGLAFLLSVHLSRDWCNWQSLMLDDPVQHIDDYRALNLVEVLAAIRRDGRQIICAVEDEALARLLSRRLGTHLGQSGALVTLEPGPQGIARIKQVQSLKLDAIRVLDRLPNPASNRGQESG
jgi:DNA repair exonuclease SbcCD ATPase subunit